MNITKSMSTLSVLIGSGLCGYLICIQFLNMGKFSSIAVACVSAYIGLILEVFIIMFHSMRTNNLKKLI